MDTWTHRYFEDEARSLLGRLQRLSPFVTRQVMVPAANVSAAASSAIERHLAEGRTRLRDEVEGFLADLQPPGHLARLEPQQVQQRWTMVRLHFGAVVTQFDLFDDVFAQRGAADHGVWLAGLDTLASDTLALERYYQAPPVVCYLDRGVGAAIRRARTRLPGGGPNPVAIVRMPRERLVGSGLASSLAHEVGHQAAALLGLVESLRTDLAGLAQGTDDSDGTDRTADPWRIWARWISEIVADLWSVARVGVASTLGLMGVVSLPRPFVFRLSVDDPHPVPWIRVLLSAAIGAALFPHPQWAALQRLWQQLYPPAGLQADRLALLMRLSDAIPALVNRILQHRPSALAGATLHQALAINDRQPDRLSVLLNPLATQGPACLERLPPSLAMATIGQARMDGRLKPEQDSRLTRHLLGHWALCQALDRTAS